MHFYPKDTKLMSRPEAKKIAKLRFKLQQNLLEKFLNDVYKTRQKNAKLFLKKLSPSEIQEILSPQIFISYAWEEKNSDRSCHLHSFLSTLAKDLKSAGLEPWLDIQKINGNLEEQMRSGIEASKNILLIGTPRYAGRTQLGSSSNVRKELDFILPKVKAKEHKDSLLPLLLEGYQYNCLLVSDTKFSSAAYQKHTLYLTFDHQTKTALISSIEDTKPVSLNELQYLALQKVLVEFKFEKSDKIIDLEFINKVRIIAGKEDYQMIFPELTGFLIRDCKNCFDLNQGELTESYLNALIEYQYGKESPSLGILPSLFGLNLTHDHREFREACLKDYHTLLKSFKHDWHEIEQDTNLKVEISQSSDSFSKISIRDQDQQSRSFVPISHALSVIPNSELNAHSSSEISSYRFGRQLTQKTDQDQKTRFTSLQSSSDISDYRFNTDSTSLTVTDIEPKNGISGFMPHSSPDIPHHRSYASSSYPSVSPKEEKYRSPDPISSSSSDISHYRLNTTSSSSSATDSISHSLPQTDLKISTAEPIHEPLNSISIAKSLIKFGKLNEEKQNFLEACQQYQAAAKMGYFKAYTYWGACALLGLGMPANKNLAYGLFLYAAQQGHPKAMVNLAKMLDQGDGISKNQRRALFWYEASGDLRSQHRAERLKIKGIKPENPGNTDFSNNNPFGFQ